MTKLHKSFDTVEVGKRIKQLRKARSLKQGDLSEVLGGLSRPQISNIETGRRNINLHQIKALADFFGVSLETLGLQTDELEVNDLLTRAKLLFDNENVSIDDKRELAEQVYNLYMLTKQKIAEKK